MKMIKWPSIEQFRNVVHTVTNHTHYAGKDANGDAVYDHTKKRPKLRFEGTVKLHGTNAAVGFSAKGQEMWCQSRENIITPEKDNAGFAMFVHGKKEVFEQMAVDIALLRDIPLEVVESQDILVFGEWCGGNIQKGVAISQLPKMFVVFGIAFVDSDGNKTHLTRKQVESIYFDKDSNVHCIYDFPTFEMEIDFEHPEMSQNELSNLTIAVEDRCPVGAELGVEGIGEGIVWRCVEDGYSDSGFWFKVKGEKHSASKVKTLPQVDEARINSLNELAMQLTPAWRLEQMVQSTFDTLNGGTPDIKRMGDFIKAVMGDIAKEELDTIAASGFNMKEVSNPVSKIAREFLINNL